MASRPEKGRGLFYHRDSEGHSSLVPPQYVEWAQRVAVSLGVKFSGTPEAMTVMIQTGRSVDGDLFLDYGIPGNVLHRPGLDALRKRALTDMSVTHLFCPRRDRIARPDHPIDAIAIERELRTAGLTLVFMDEKPLAPTPPGSDTNLGEDINSWIEYHMSGRFRRELAEKLIHAKVRLAQSGFSIGGDPPYGFRRWLCSEDGVPKRQLEDHERVKMPGYHVLWLPTATNEIQVVRRILDLIVTTPASRIARMLNDEGIPSPMAGKVRTRNGVQFEISGLWAQNTVTNIVTHPLLIAMWEYGKRSEGDQRRFTKDGPRQLSDGDYHPDGKLKTVANPDDQWIRTPAKSEPVTTPETFDKIKEIIENRGRHLKGKPRTRGQSPNPLGGRIHDLNCGWLMYRYPKRKKWSYVCGLYQNSESKCCHHNVVPGEAATRFVLACLRQFMLNPSILDKVKARLDELATAEQGDDPAKKQMEADQAELILTRRKLEKVAENMALAESPAEREATAVVFRKLKSQEATLEQRINAHRPPSLGVEPQQQVQAALGVLDRLAESLASTDPDWSAVGDAFNLTNARLYLRFSEVFKGRQKLNVLAGGVVTFGSTPPPGPLYTGPTDRPIIRRMLAAGESVTAFPVRGESGDSNAGQDVIGSAIVQRGTRRCT